MLPVLGSGLNIIIIRILKHTSQLLCCGNSNDMYYHYCNNGEGVMHGLIIVTRIL
jgi:hypothetical protein